MGMINKSAITAFSVIIILFALYGAIPHKITWEDSSISPVLISEICTSNHTAAYDDTGSYGADYIEIYNNSENTIDLEGYMLTKGRNSFVFPSLTVAPGQAVIAWCDEYSEDASEYRKGYMPRDIHDLGFRLSVGDKCILSDRQGEILSTVSIPNNLPEDRVYATSLHQKGEYSICDPSPYFLQESIFEKNETTLSEMPDYSMAGGWYDDAITVEIDGRGGEVYYTTDGSEPDENSTHYEGPIIISDRSIEDNIYSSIRECSVVNEYIPDHKVDKCTTLKSVIIKGGNKSRVRSESYFVGLSGEPYDTIPTISVSMPPEDLFGYENGIYVTGKVYDLFYDKYGYAEEYDYANYMGRGRGWEREAEIEYYSPEHVKVFEQQVGIRIHGGSSRTLNQKSFNLYARKEYDGNDSFIVDPLSETSDDPVRSKLVLRSGGEVDLYITKMRDVLFQSLALGRDVGTQRAKPCNVFLNGEYWGTYNLQEGVNEEYIQEHYGVDPDNVIYVKNERANKKRPDANAMYNEMIRFAKEHDLSDEENYRHMEEIIDMQSCIDYFAAEIYCANPDAFVNNLVAWRTVNAENSEYGDCRWRWILLDLDEGAALKTEDSAADIDSFVEGNYWESLIGDNALFTALMQNEKFRTSFEESFREMLKTNYSYDKTSLRLKEMASLYKMPNIMSQNRFRGDFVDEGYFPGLDYKKPYTEEDFDRDIQVIDDFLKERNGYIEKYMEKHFEELGS